MREGAKILSDVIWFVIQSSPVICSRNCIGTRGEFLHVKQAGCALHWGSTSCTYLCHSYLSRLCYPRKQGTVSLSWGPYTLYRRVKGHEKDAFTARSGTGSTLDRKEALGRSGVEHSSCLHPR